VSNDPNAVLAFKNVNIACTPMETVADIENVSNSKVVITGVHGQFNLGEHIAIIGKVGSGKSSLLMAILGELPVTQGVLSI
jgi:ABC-type transport system involved in cytochrome bd biosynthesis fused ATPase/permease subunit